MASAHEGLYYPTIYSGILTSVLDDKRRIVVPKEMADELGLSEGTMVAFQKGKDGIIVKKIEGTAESLNEIMSSNPKRTGKPESIEESEIKRIWR